MLAELFHAPGETTGTSTQGSSEAIMLGALSLKWKWRQRREAEGKSTDNPNLVFSGDVHVVWEKFCRYFDVEPRIVPLQPGKYTIGPEDIEPHIDENTIGVAAVVGTTFTGHADDVAGINDLLELKDRKGLDVPLHIDGASGAFVWPFLYPHSEWDFRLEQVRSINASGHKFGLVYPGIGWLIFREKSDLAEDLVFYENYLGKTDATFTVRRVRHRVPAGRGAGVDGARLHDAAERPEREDDASAGQAQPEPLAGQHAGRRHRLGGKDARGERSRKRVRAQAGQDQR
jgi:glutamate decarboxylase